MASTSSSAIAGTDTEHATLRSRFTNLPDNGRSIRPCGFSITSDTHAEMSRGRTHLRASRGRTPGAERPGSVLRSPDGYTCPDTTKPGALKEGKASRALPVNPRSERPSKRSAFGDTVYPLCVTTKHHATFLRSAIARPGVLHASATPPRRPLVAPTAAELDTRHRTRPSRLTHPRHRHVQLLRHLVRVQQQVGHDATSE